MYVIALKSTYDIDYLPLPHRLCCNGHIINLAAQAFLFQSNSNTLSYDNNTNSFAVPTENEMESWRQQGPLGKLHNIVVYIQRSTQRIQAFKELSGGQRLVRDNSTRWNSWFMMIRTAIEPRISVASSVYAVNTAVFSPNNTYGSTTSNQKYVLYHTAVQ